MYGEPVFWANITLRFVEEEDEFHDRFNFIVRELGRVLIYKLLDID